MIQNGKTLPEWPFPFQLAMANPAQTQKLGFTLKK